ncbi:MAG: FAD-binding oxidoreductase [Litorimonas sp.]
MTAHTPVIDSVAILGGGIFGVSAAVHLARLGVSVNLVNDGPLGGGASSRSLAWLNSAGSRPAAYHTLRTAGIERYRTLSASEPNSDWLRFDGGLFWRGSDRESEIVPRHEHEVAIGYPSERLLGEDAARRIQGVRAGAIPPIGAILNAAEGWVDLPTLIARLADELVTLGGHVITDAGTAEPVLTDNRVIGLRCADGRKISADVVLLAAGAAVPNLTTMLGCPIADATPIALLIESESVDHPLQVVLNTPRVAVRRTPTGAFLFDSGWSEREVVLGDDGRPQARQKTIDGLVAALRDVLDPVPDIRVAGIHMGPKPIPADGLPVFGSLPGVENCYVAFSHSGATLGLISGELIAQEIALGISEKLLKPFRPDRLVG